MGGRGSSSGMSGGGSGNFSKYSDSQINEQLSNVNKELNNLNQKAQQMLLDRPFGETARPKGLGKIEDKARALRKKKVALQEEQSRRYKAKTSKDHDTKVKEAEKRAESIARIQSHSKQGRKEKRMYEKMIDGFAGKKNPYHGK